MFNKIEVVNSIIFRKYVKKKKKKSNFLKKYIYLFIIIFLEPQVKANNYEPESNLTNFANR